MIDMNDTSISILILITFAAGILVEWVISEMARRESLSVKKSDEV